MDDTLREKLTRVFESLAKGEDGLLKAHSTPREFWTHEHKTYALGCVETCLALLTLGRVMGALSPKQEPERH